MQQERERECVCVCMHHNGCGKLLVGIIQFYSCLGNLVWQDFLAVLQISIAPHTTWDFNQSKTKQECACDKPKRVGAGYGYAQNLIPAAPAPQPQTSTLSSYQILSSSCKSRLCNHILILFVLGPIATWLLQLQSVSLINVQTMFSWGKKHSARYWVKRK